MVIGIRLLTALLILGSPFILGRWLTRRYNLGASWLTIGVLVFMGAFIGQTLIVLFIPTIFLNNPVMGGVLVGLTTALTDTVARGVGYQTIASEAVYRAHAYLIGVGYALLPMLFTGAGLVFDMASHIYQGSTADIDNTISLAETITSLASLIWYLSLSWLVLQSFIRGQLGWLFGAILWGAIVAGTQTFILNGSLDPITVNSVWWGFVAIISFGILYLTQAPPAFRWQAETVRQQEITDVE